MGPSFHFLPLPPRLHIPLRNSFADLSSAAAVFLQRHLLRPLHRPERTKETRRTFAVHRHQQVLTLIRIRSAQGFAQFIGVLHRSSLSSLDRVVGSEHNTEVMR